MDVTIETKYFHIESFDQNHYFWITKRNLSYFCNQKFKDIDIGYLDIIIKSTITGNKITFRYEDDYNDKNILFKPMSRDIGFLYLYIVSSEKEIGK